MVNIIHSCDDYSVCFDDKLTVRFWTEGNCDFLLLVTNFWLIYYENND